MMVIINKITIKHKIIINTTIMIKHKMNVHRRKIITGKIMDKRIIINTKATVVGLAAA